MVRGGDLNSRTQRSHKVDARQSGHPRNRPISCLNGGW